MISLRICNYTGSTTGYNAIQNALKPHISMIMRSGSPLKISSLTHDFLYTRLEIGCGGDANMVPYIFDIAKKAYIKEPNLIIKEWNINGRGRWTDITHKINKNLEFPGKDSECRLFS